MYKILCFVLIVISLVKANILYDLNKEEFNQLKESRNFTEKVVLVTGSNSGIGEGIVKLFSFLGAHVIVHGRNATTIEKVALEVQELSPNKLKPLEVVGDVTKSEDLEHLINETIKTYGKLDVLVNNAGIYSNNYIRDKNFMQTFDSIFNTDLRAVAQLNHLSVPHLLKTNGSIIQISSIGGLRPYIGDFSQAMAKAGVDMMTKCLALELGPLGVRVNSVNPGSIKTPGIGPIKPDDPWVKRTPLRRIGQVLDVAKGVVFLASSDASFITGANLVIDGGLVYN